MTAIKNNKVIKVCLVAFFLNFILFAVKLYVGLASNIISIYSDGINNFFDSLSCLATSLCFMMAVKNNTSYHKPIIAKTEQLLSAVLSAVVILSGSVFAYNSLERLMYPTPVWFSTTFFGMLTCTAFCKLAMYFYLRKQHSKIKSDILKMMCLDNRLDFFINLVTLITLSVSKMEFYAFDSFCGIAISVLIIVSGIKNLTKTVKELINLPDKQCKNEIEDILHSHSLSEKNCEITFLFTDKKRVFISTKCEIDDTESDQIRQQVSEKTGMEIFLLK